jgi:hypothetical protein
LFLVDVGDDTAFLNATVKHHVAPLPLKPRMEEKLQHAGCSRVPANPKGPCLHG